MNGENFYVYKKRQPKRLVLIFSSIIILKLAFDVILILGWNCLKGKLNRLDLKNVG